MKKTFVNIESNPLIDYHGKLLFLGSCFSENLSQKLQETKFQVEVNPFGVIFNPISLGDFLTLSDEEIENSVFMREDVALSWLANSTIFAYSKEELQKKLLQLRSHFLENLKEATLLFVTFGTAWIYENDAQKVVANCHKISQSEFTKRLLSLEEITHKWEDVLSILHQRNPNLKVVFTVSPVRHSKDGLVENSRSKAHLISAVHQLVETHDFCSYFPAYELMIDEMRDYGYFGKDGVHPNEIAIENIWERVKEHYLTEETKVILAEYESLKAMQNHKLLHPDSEQSRVFYSALYHKTNIFLNKYPFFKERI